MEQVRSRFGDSYDSSRCAYGRSLGRAAYRLFRTSLGSEAKTVSS